jgi:hypothetical protein
MATDPKLTRDWIQFLKNNQLVSMKSDPATGQLKYKKPITTDILYKFLTDKTGYDPKVITSVIQQVAFGKGGAQPQQPPAAQSVQQSGTAQPQQPSTTLPVQQPAPKPTAPQLAPPTQPSQAAKSAPVSASRPHAANQPVANPFVANDEKFNSNPNAKNMSNAEWLKSLPRAQAERKPKPHYKLGPNGKPEYKGLKEAIAANPGATLDEKDVERVFAILSKEQKQGKTKVANQQPAPLTSQQKIQDLNKIKKTIRDTMSPQQRSTLYRALEDDGSLYEQQITPADAKSILKGAATLRNDPGLVRSIPGLRRDKVELSDLQQAWKAAGYPDDTQEIAAILHKKFGYNYNEVKKVFAKVLGKDNEEEHGYASQEGTPAIQKIADYIKKNGLADDVKQYLKDNYSDDIGLTKPGMFSKMFKKKAVTEEIRQIFEEILEEERTDRIELIQLEDRTNLGRTKK